jgi:hypothetical protein
MHEARQAVSARLTRASLGRIRSRVWLLLLSHAIAQVSTQGARS